MERITKYRSLAVDWISLLFILIFVYAAVSKLYDYQKFVSQLGQSEVLSDIKDIIAWAVPTLELFISIFLIFTKTKLVGLYLCFGLMVLFTTYIYSLMNFSEEAPCSCGGILEHLPWTAHLWFNVFLIFLAAIAVLIYPNTHRLAKG